jgi:purine catabolism regulator
VYPTLTDILELPVLRHGRPTVAAGHRGLANQVRWAHVAEVADIGHLLRGGELVLTTGIALPNDAAGLRKYVAELTAAGASGVVIELVRRWQGELPQPLLDAADDYRLPVITLAAETRFVSVTQAVIERVQDAQTAELVAAERVHEIFTALTTSGAEPAEVLREVVDLVRRPVVLENLSHDVLAYHAANENPSELLADWQHRSAAVSLGERTGYHADSGWLVTVVGARGDDWGRLVLLTDEAPPHREVVVIERAASALAVHRLVTRERESLERQTHRTVLTELLGGTSTELVSRVEALGVPLTERTLIGLAVHPRAGTGVPAQALAVQEVLRDLADAVALAARRDKVPALVSTLGDNSVRGLLSLPQRRNPDAALLRLARHIRRATTGGKHAIQVIVAIGTPVTELADARRSLDEATHVVHAAGRDTASLEAPDRDLYRLQDVRLRGLLHLLREDTRLTAFAERELGPLLARDARTGSRLVDVLRYLCENGGNKSAAAAAAHLSRTAYYQQLDRVEQVLGVSLSDAESVLSLYVALLARDT